MTEAQKAKRRAAVNKYCYSEKGQAKRKRWVEANREKVRAAQARYRVGRGKVVHLAWRKRNPEKLKNWALGSKYGMSLSDFKALLKAQSNKCAACGHKFGTEKRDWPNVDHCHETGEVRGLLCNGCNVGIAALGDDIEGVRNALAYLIKWQAMKVRHG